MYPQNISLQTAYNSQNYFSFCNPRSTMLAPVRKYGFVTENTHRYCWSCTTGGRSITSFVMIFNSRTFKLTQIAHGYYNFQWSLAPFSTVDLRGTAKLMEIINLANACPFNSQLIITKAGNWMEATWVGRRREVVDGCERVCVLLNGPDELMDLSAMLVRARCVYTHSMCSQPISSSNQINIAHWILHLS